MENSNEYRLGQLIRATVKRFERGNIILDIGNQEGILAKTQQMRGQILNPGDRTSVVIDNARSPISVSRTSTELLKRLLEIEVPEILAGTIIIKAVAREPVEKAKIAVTSNNRDIDPVIICGGVNGSHLQPIIKELGGEKIDIVRWSEDPLVFVSNALTPARIERIKVTDAELRHIEVVVAEDQLSTAIGKRGVNMRLAAQLTGWRIDLKSSDD